MGTAKEIDEWIAIVTNRGAVVVIAAIVIGLVAGVAWLLYSLLRDLLPEVKGWFREMKQSTIANKESLQAIRDSMKEIQTFQKAIAEDRRHCMTNTQIALLATKAAKIAIKNHPDRKELEPIVDEMAELALDAFIDPAHKRLSLTH